MLLLLILYVFLVLTQSMYIVPWKHFTTIQLYVQLFKYRLNLQAKVDVVEDMDMCMKVKQLGPNMRLQVAFVLRPFLDFMDSFKLFKTHHMLVLMLDPCFKDLSLVGDYVRHV